MSISRENIEAKIIEKAAEDEAFLKQLKENPKEAVAEFLPDEVDIPEGVNIKLVQETPTELVLRLPFSLHEQEELSADELDSVAAGGYIDGGKKETIKSAAGNANAIHFFGVPYIFCATGSQTNG